MIRFGSQSAQICVVGRLDFDTGIGAIAYATAELLARSFQVAFFPLDPAAREQPCIRLPNGRMLPVWSSAEPPAVSVYCDVVANGVADRKLESAPRGRLNYVWLLFDSDRLPPDWVRRLERHADILLVPSPHLLDVARSSGVTRPLVHLPIPLDLDAVLAAPPASAGRRFTFGSVAAFHSRKALDTLVRAFRGRFGDDPTAQLVIHGHLAFADTLPRLLALADGAPNIRISRDSLPATAKQALIASFDVFVSASRGEGFGIGAREALAAGKPVVASAVGGHLALAGLPGVFLVPPAFRVPARYPEIDNAIFGQQDAVCEADLADALEAARRYAACQPTADPGARRLAAARWSFPSLASSLGALIDPAIGRYRIASHPPPADAETVIEQRLGRRADCIGGPRRQVCAAHDGGFFSVFNAFISHLVWQEREDRCHAVLPDWDIDRLMANLEAPLRSFCYGQPGDGNLWCRLFQPLFGATNAEMQDRNYLWRHAELPPDRHNEQREPTLTYVRAYQLYRSLEFASIRRQYHRVFRRHIHLHPALAAEVDTFAAEHLAVPILIAAHVRHPSHTIEQPSGRIAETERYIARVREEVTRRGGDPDGAGWAVFVLTDQDRVLRQFHEAFGSRAVFYPDARRTRADEDAAFDALSPDEQNREGHQLQHLVAADPSGWTWRMAWEVTRDAWTAARCHALLHVVSNVSTAVAYMNPELDMLYCDA